MLWNTPRNDDASGGPQGIQDRRAHLARRIHELWLSRAIDSGRSYPHIPLRAVSEGGFGPLVRTPRGRAWADEWWAGALDQVD